MAERKEKNVLLLDLAIYSSCLDRNLRILLLSVERQWLVVETSERRCAVTRTDTNFRWFTAHPLPPTGVRWIRWVNYAKPKGVSLAADFGDGLVRIKTNTRLNIQLLRGVECGLFKSRIRNRTHNVNNNHWIVID